MVKKLTYVIYKDGNWYVAENLEYGVASQGKTVSEAKRNLREAVELYLEDAEPRRTNVGHVRVGTLELP